MIAGCKHKNARPSDVYLRAVLNCESGMLSLKSNRSVHLAAPLQVRLVWLGFRELKTSEGRPNCRRARATATSTGDNYQTPTNGRSETKRVHTALSVSDGQYMSDLIAISEQLISRN
jgi:hypothetical protein